MKLRRIFALAIILPLSLAGAGSAYVQGSEDLALPTGTEVTVCASAPR